MEKRIISTTVTKIIHIYITTKSTCVIVNKMQAKYQGSFNPYSIIFEQKISHPCEQHGPLSLKNSHIVTHYMLHLHGNWEFIYMFIYAQVSPIHTYPTTRTSHKFLEKIHFNVSSHLCLGLMCSLLFSF